MAQEQSNTGAIFAIVAFVLLLAGFAGFAIYMMNKSNSSPPTNSNNNSKNKHDSDHSDDLIEQVDDCNSDDDCKPNSQKKTCNNNDCENTKLNNKCVVKKCTKKEVQEVHLCKSDDDCKNNLENKTCDVDCADKEGNNKCVFKACPGIKCETNSDCADNTYKTVCDLKKKVCDFNKSIIITGESGKIITVDPDYALTKTGYNQTQTGCFSLDNQSDWQDALKGGSRNAYCKVKSITLPPNIQATTYYTNGGWYDICSKDSVETIAGPTVDHKTKDTACGFMFKKVKNV